MSPAGALLEPQASSSESFPFQDAVIEAENAVAQIRAAAFFEWFKTSRDFVPVYKARGHGSESHSRSSPFLSGHPEAWKGPMRRA